MNTNATGNTEAENAMTKPRREWTVTLGWACDGCLDHPSFA